MENKKYMATKYLTKFYADTLEDLANDIKTKYPTNTKIFYPAEWNPLYRIYVAMNYYGYDIDTLQKKSYPKKNKPKSNRKVMMYIEVNHLYTLIINILESEQSSELEMIVKQLYEKLPDKEKKHIEELHSDLLEIWDLK